MREGDKNSIHDLQDQRVLLSKTFMKCVSSDSAQIFWQNEAFMVNWTCLLRHTYPFWGQCFQDWFRALLNKLIHLDNTAEWKTRILRKILTAGPVAESRASILLSSIVYRHDFLPIPSGSAVCIWHNILIFHFAGSSTYNSFIYGYILIQTEFQRAVYTYNTITPWSDCRNICGK